MHKDVHVQEIDDGDSDTNKPQLLNKSQPTADIKHFFKKAQAATRTKGRVSCVCCACVFTSTLPGGHIFLSTHTGKELAVA